jgi:hypothetical protein
MLRITLAALAVAVIVVLVAGCGSSNTASNGASGAMTTAQDVAFARAVNLRAADIPELTEEKAEPPDHETRTGPLGRAIESCDGAGGPARAIVGITSPEFRRSTARGTVLVLGLSESVRSAVYFVPSAPLAAREYAATASSRASSCLMRNLVREHVTTKREGGAAQPFFTQIGVSSLPSPLRGLPIYWLRWSARLAFEAPGFRGRVPSFNDYLGFAIGRAIVTLHERSGRCPFPATTERRLLSLLYSRAKAHRL